MGGASGRQGLPRPLLQDKGAWAAEGWGPCTRHPWHAQAGRHMASCRDSLTERPRAPKSLRRAGTQAGSPPGWGVPSDQQGCLHSAHERGEAAGSHKPARDAQRPASWARDPHLETRGWLQRAAGCTVAKAPAQQPRDRPQPDSQTQTRPARPHVAGKGVDTQPPWKAPLPHTQGVLSPPTDESLPLRAPHSPRPTLPPAGPTVPRPAAPPPRSSDTAGGAPRESRAEASIHRFRKKSLMQ